ncbi:TIGR01244 family phosphatase [Paracoccus sp. S-4012]|uniref:TIGR01244 family sulfur transferase n=1 Tax=Paracoccus sp. S-4012 TaxID=2665648 RepID=UPI0012AFFD85|nr:TIGR01244 family sulfur transferase [Paracoccus sp. S-4012]MRX51246.1 TIGR01244 family phosphatase [Paracoccus sp. S-4012]
MTNPRRLTDALSVLPQIDPAEIPELARQGFRVLIDNRPDAEVGAGIDSRVMEDAARAAGMEFRYVPFVPGQVTPEMVEDFAAALDLPGPALAYCRSGTRSTTLWALTQAGRRSPQDILGTAAAAGYDLSHMAPMLAAKARG